MKLYKYITMPLGIRDNGTVAFWVLRRFWLHENRGQMIWEIDMWSTETDYKTHSACATVAKRLAARPGCCYGLRWTIFPTKDELRQVAGFTDDAPDYMVRDRILELLTE
jgi:hypothetical protein